METKTYEEGLEFKFAPYNDKIESVLKTFKGMDFETISECLYEVKRRAEKGSILA